MAEEAGRFAFADVARGIADKMIRRHPHVFAGAAVKPDSWEAGKSRERQARQQGGALAGVPVGLPALTRAAKLTARAELPGADPARLADEVGDMLFVLANLARKLGLNPETCLQAANAKFTRRFEGVEARLAAEGQTPQEAGLDGMEAAWKAVKASESGRATNASPTPGSTMSR